MSDAVHVLLHDNVNKQNNRRTQKQFVGNSYTHSKLTVWCRVPSEMLMTYNGVPISVNAGAYQTIYEILLGRLSKTI